MFEIDESARLPLTASFATCGGDGGPMFPAALAIAAGKNSLLGAVPKELLPATKRSLGMLEKEAVQGKITSLSVLRRYGNPSHFRDMKEEAANKQLFSVAAEVPANLRPLLHTLLPVRNGRYENQGLVITLNGLVPLGPQKGLIVAHLAGSFSCYCQQEEIDDLLKAQTECPEFMEMLKTHNGTTFDYEGTRLQAATKRAKHLLGL
ncbi:MAG: hypothetical protein PHW75_01515 [Patescibacteria group bacterium]|nr:hypothetical protein [Patescibacteria group bacterium]